MCAYIQVTNKQVHWQDDQQDKTSSVRKELSEETAVTEKSIHTH